MPIGQIHRFVTQQLQEWDLAGANYAALKDVRIKTIPYNNYDILIQFNPRRIISTSAKVDKHSIETRPCFLCEQNLPRQQRSIPFKKDYLILVNPFPIFKKHLTIPKRSHTDQRITGNFEDLLDLCHYLTDFTVIYNGPKCGASAPDHFHFQAGNKGFMPIEEDFARKSVCSVIMQSEYVTIYTWKDYLRNAITIEGKNKEALIRWFDHFMLVFTRLQPLEPEPMLNIVAWFDEEKWLVHLFPRKWHRPRQYFEEGAKQILLSPASVDLGGTLITPREEDFNKITSEDIRDIFSQVCLEEETIKSLISKL